MRNKTEIGLGCRIVGSFPGGPVVKNLPANAGDSKDTDSIPGWGRSPGGGSGNPVQYGCLENPMDGGAWWSTVHGVPKSWTWLSTPARIHMWNRCLVGAQLSALWWPRGLGCRGREGGLRRRGYMYHRADSHCWIAETNTTLQSSYPPTNKNKGDPKDEGPLS